MKAADLLGRLIGAMILWSVFAAAVCVSIEAAVWLHSSWQHLLSLFGR